MTTKEFSQGPGLLSGDGWIGQWSPGIGDPTVLGWLIVVMYALGAWYAYKVATMHANLLRPGEGTLWWILVYGLVALGVNKQLDLQSALTEIGRILARQQGWYEKRREVQILFTYGVVTLVTCAIVVMVFLMRKVPRVTLFALVGSVCLLLFVIVRTATFQHLNVFADSIIYDVGMNSLEVGGLCIIIIGARLRLKTTK